MIMKTKLSFLLFILFVTCKVFGTTLEKIGQYYPFVGRGAIEYNEFILVPVAGPALMVLPQWSCLGPALMVLP